MNTRFYSFLAWFFTVSSLAMLAHCGARTGLMLDGAGGASADADTDAIHDAEPEPPPPPCVPGPLTLAKAKPAVIFVIDRSGSMGDALGTNNGRAARWELLTAAL